MTTEDGPCRCCRIYTLITDWHPGHCCFLTNRATCHQDAVQAWCREYAKRFGGFLAQRKIHWSYRPKEN